MEPSPQRALLAKAADLCRYHVLGDAYVISFSLAHRNSLGELPSNPPGSLIPSLSYPCHTLGRLRWGPVFPLRLPPLLSLEK